MDTPKFEIVEKIPDLLVGQSFDRIGPPIDIEEQRRSQTDAPTTVSKRHTLQDLSCDYVFCTVGPLLVASPFDRDPIEVVQQQYPAGHRDEWTLVLDIPTPVFFGLGTVLVSKKAVDLDRRLYAIPQHRWARFRDILAGIMISQPKTGYLGRVLYHTVDIPDPLQRGMWLATVTVFGVITQRRSAYLQSTAFPNKPYLAYGAGGEISIDTRALNAGDI